MSQITDSVCHELLSLAQSIKRDIESVKRQYTETGFLVFRACAVRVRGGSAPALPLGEI
jgi:hypothetical protein